MPDFIAGLLLLLTLAPAQVLANDPATETLDLTGEWQPGAMVVGKTAPGTRVYFESREVQVDEQGRFVVGLGRDASGSVNLVLDNGSGKQTFSYTVAGREYDIQRIEGVPQETVTPPKAVLERIRKETAMVKRARAASAERGDFYRGFIKPLEGPITGVYGSQRVYNGVPKRPHYGLDIARPAGTPVQAPAAGVVKLAHPDMYYSGGTLIIDHGYGISTTFIHLSEVLVEEGAFIEQGQEVALVGAGGRATGPHLDWRMNWYEVRLDPALVLRHFPLLAPGP